MSTIETSYQNVSLAEVHRSVRIPEGVGFWRKMLAFALEGITSFSVFPLRIITMIGFAVFAFTVMMTIWILWVRFFSDRAVPGWASTVLPLYFIGGIQILCIGIVGEYLGKIYQEVKRRPRYTIESYIGGPAPAPEPDRHPAAPAPGGLPQRG